ncbi:MAG: shikimate kinase [Clostridiales bacterium]|nr:shikimate kinase [Clostridiales bacterium]
MNIVLTGFMASGKTEISKILAKKLDYKLIDTDECIERNEGTTINELFEKYGEEYFRSLEHEVVKKAAKEDRAVISTGGGVVLNRANIDALRQNGIIINLAPDFETIRERIERAAATRPLMKNSSIEEIRERFIMRKAFYENCDKKVVVTNSKTPGEHAEEIIKIMSEYL